MPSLSDYGKSPDYRQCDAAGDFGIQASAISAFLLPESFDARDVLPKELHKRADDANYLVSTILKKIAAGKADSSGRVVLNAANLRNIMARDDYVKVVNALLKAGVIHRDSYRVGKKSYGYQLDDRYQYDTLVRTDVTSPRLKRRLMKFHDDWRKEQRNRMDKVHFHLERLQQRLSIDRDHATSILAALPRGKNRFDTQGHLVNQLAQQRMHFSVGKNGRVSNSITNLSRELRPALRLDGRPLVCLDLKNSQPALLGMMVRDAAKIGAGGGSTIYDAENENPNRAVTHGSLAGCCDLDLYCELSQGGRVYEAIQAELPGYTRDQVKARFMPDVLAKGKVNERGGEYPSAVEDCFKKLFPTVFTFIRRTNQNGFQHANVIRLLQQMEAKLVIRTVCEDLRVNHPTVAVVTLHDSIYSTEDNMAVIREAFERAFEQNHYLMTLQPG